MLILVIRVYQRQLGILTSWQQGEATHCGMAVGVFLSMVAVIGIAGIWSLFYEIQWRHHLLRRIS